jgi:MFS family permease
LNKLNDQLETSNYKWYILALAALTHTFVVAIPLMALPVLFDDISAELGLTIVQVGWVWGLGSLTGIFTGLAGGALGDRFGARQALIAGCFLAGLTGALRGLSNDFVTLAATSLLFGLVQPAIPMNVHKVCGVWFSGQRLGLANGVVSAGMALGFMLASLLSATLLSPWLGGWRNVLVLYGALSIGMNLLWYFTQAEPAESRPVREKLTSPIAAEPPAGPASFRSPRVSVGVYPKTEPHPATQDKTRLSFRQALPRIARLRNIWLVGLAMLGISGCIQGVLGYLPLYLREIGWTAANADGALATFHGASMLATIPLAMLSDRLGSRRGVLLAATLMIAGGTGLLSFTTGSLVWSAVVIAGLARDGFMAILMTMIIEIRGVGPAYAGTATGLVMVFIRLGSLISPPLGNSLAYFDLALPFLFWAALALLGLLGFYFFKEEPSS